MLKEKGSNVMRKPKVAYRSITKTPRDPNSCYKFTQQMARDWEYSKTLGEPVSKYVIPKFPRHIVYSGDKIPEFVFRSLAYHAPSADITINLPGFSKSYTALQEAPGIIVKYLEAHHNQFRERLKDLVVYTQGEHEVKYPRFCELIDDPKISQITKSKMEKELWKALDSYNDDIRKKVKEGPRVLYRSQNREYFLQDVFYRMVISDYIQETGNRPKRQGYIYGKNWVKQDGLDLRAFPIYCPNQRVIPEIVSEIELYESMKPEGVLTEQQVLELFNEAPLYGIEIPILILEHRGVKTKDHGYTEETGRRYGPQKTSYMQMSPSGMGAYDLSDYKPESLLRYQGSSKATRIDLAVPQCIEELTKAYCMKDLYETYQQLQWFKSVEDPELEEKVWDSDEGWITLRDHRKAQDAMTPEEISKHYWHTGKPNKDYWDHERSQNKTPWNDEI